MKSVLVAGGSGYLGQFLVVHLSEKYKVFYTYNNSAVDLPTRGEVKGFKVDFLTGEGLDDCLKNIGALDVVVNCAAISQPRLCETDPEKARSLNVPNKLMESLQVCKTQSNGQPLLIHLSTDQVYDGEKGNYSECDACIPVNEYGTSKLLAETAIQERWANHVILRSSIILGPQSPIPVSRPLMLDFIRTNLSAGNKTKFFYDEFRCPVSVMDIVSIVDAMAQKSEFGQRLFNMGGPERLSRVDMAQKVAKRLGLDHSLIEEVPSSSVERGCASPPDNSMDSGALVKELGIRLATFEEVLENVFE